MAEKNFWQDKWVKDQFNERGPGQRFDPEAKKTPQPEKQQPTADDVLRVMLNTPPQPHKPAVEKPKSKVAKKKPPK